MQACHSAHKSGLKDTHQYQEETSIVLIQIPNKETLEKELVYFQSLGIDCAPFYEPYDDMGLTSFATLPLTEDKRHLFKSYTLWGRGVKGNKTPLTEFLKQEMKEEQRKKKEKLAQELISSKIEDSVLVQSNVNHQITM